jgi:hypothetical protein
MKEEYISKCKEYKLVVEQDVLPESPDTWGNEDMFLVYDHRQFTVTRKGFTPIDVYHHLKGVKDRNEEKHSEFIDDIQEIYDNYYIYPVAAYIHSGVALSLTNSFKKQRFDKSVTGFVLVNKESLEDECYKDWLSTNKNDYYKLAKYQAEGLIETWNQYLSGDVYEFTLRKANKRYSISADNFQNLIDSGYSFDDYIRNEYFTEEIGWELIDSCSGFYGDDIKTNGILDHIPNNVEFEL